MEIVQRVRKTDLARNTHQVIRAVQRGETAVIENHGEPEAAILDILDYRILRAVVRFYAGVSSRAGAEREPLRDRSGIGSADSEEESLSDSQARFDLTLARYLDGSISLARAAELLGIPWLDLRTRFLRLDVPLRVGPEDLAEAADDVEAAMTWAEGA